MFARVYHYVEPSYYEKAFVRILDSFKPRDHITIVDGELGWGCNKGIADAFIRAMQRGAKITYNKNILGKWKLLQKTERLTIGITQVPIGPAPDWVRQEWVGVVMPAVSKFFEANEYDFVLKQFTKIHRAGYIVEINDALQALEKKSLDAAKWLRNIIPDNIPGLIFGRDEAVIMGK